MPWVTSTLECDPRRHAPNVAKFPKQEPPSKLSEESNRQIPAPDMAKLLENEEFLIKTNRVCEKTRPPHEDELIMPLNCESLIELP
jgi:hypothetical protein